MAAKVFFAILIGTAALAALKGEGYYVVLRDEGFMGCAAAFGKEVLYCAPDEREDALARGGPPKGIPWCTCYWSQDSQRPSSPGRYRRPPISTTRFLED